jgi:hypothetical protein
MDVAVVGFWQMDLAVVGFLANGGSCKNRKERSKKARFLNSAFAFSLSVGTWQASSSSLQAHHLNH